MWRRELHASITLGACVVVAMVTRATPAVAEQSIIKTPGDHPLYAFEAEPHGIVGIGGPFKDKGHFGAGFRGTIVIVDKGFIPRLNNSVGIGFGGDVLFGEKKGTLFVPVVMQWNFWLTTRWSVFGEPGVALAAKAFELKAPKDIFHPIIFAGGRYHFSEKISLTMRVGYPGASVGVSFFL